jgi:hypothetical protein
MNDQSPRFVTRLRIFVPLAVLVLILAGATTAFASGAFESNGSGFDRARDVAERGSVTTSTTTRSQPDATDDVGDDKGVDAVSASGAATQAQDQTTSNLPDGTADSNATHVDNSGPGNASDDKAADDNSGPGNNDDSNSGPGNSSDTNSGHGSGHSSDG